MDDTIPQGPSPDTSPDKQDQTARHSGSVVAFQPPSRPEDRRLPRLPKLFSRDLPAPSRKADNLLSKHAPPDWNPAVGDRVAGVAGDRIVQGTILGTKANPSPGSALPRSGIAGCWIQLDNGERVAANRLRPIQGSQAGKEICTPIPQSSRSSSRGAPQRHLPFPAGHYYCFEPEVGFPDMLRAEEARRNADQDDICEAVFRYEILNKPWGPGARATVFFLSVTEGRNPTDEFMSRLRGDFRVRKISQAVQSPYEGVRHVKSRERGVIIGVGRITWISADEVMVDGGYYYDGHNSAGSVYRVCRERGSWVVKEKRDCWIS